MQNLAVSDLLTMEPHTPSPEPQRYQKNGGDWYNQNITDTPSTFIQLADYGSKHFVKGHYGTDILLTTYKPRVRSLWENLRLRPCRIDLAIAQSRDFGRLRFSCKDQTFEVNKLSIICLFAWLLQALFYRTVGIMGE